MANARRTYTYTPFDYADYQKSQEVRDKEARQRAAENAVKDYGGFKYSRADLFSDIIGKVMNREDFSYDINEDALYNHYKDNYIKHGKMASADVAGQAAALTGGFITS